MVAGHARIEQAGQKRIYARKLWRNSRTLAGKRVFRPQKGAFTGASTDSRGYLHRADGGTLFLDEVGELRLDMQVKLLRAIDGGTYFPVGDSISRRSDFRLISATNRNLRDMVKSGGMREVSFFGLI